MPGRSRFTVTRYVLLCVVVILIAPIHGSAWGDIGHRIVARIASRYLNPQARAAIVGVGPPSSLKQLDGAAVSRQVYLARAMW